MPNEPTAKEPYPASTADTAGIHDVAGPVRRYRIYAVHAGHSAVVACRLRHVQLTMASYLVGMALSELFYGPVADRFGRRPVMFVGAGILTAGAVICLLSFSIWPLIGGRLVQGVGATAGGVIAKAAVRDAFARDQRERVYAQLNAAFALAPAIGPVVGSLVANSLNWHINFAILTALSALLWLLTWRYLPETKPKVNPRALQPARLWRNYKRALKQTDF